MQNLSRLNLFAEVVNSGSFAAAARRLGVSASAVGKGINRLERQLNVDLFQRNTRNISLTEEGKELLARFGRIQNEIRLIEDDLIHRCDNNSGRLRISLPSTAGPILSAVSSFMDTYPSIKMEIDFTDFLPNLVEEAIDVALITQDIPDSQLLTKILIRVPFMMAASPTYLKNHGYPKTPRDFLSHKLLRRRALSQRSVENWPLPSEFLDEIDSNSYVICNNIDSMLFLAKNNKGILCLPKCLLLDYLEKGELMQIPFSDFSSDCALRAVWRNNKFGKQRRKLFVDFLSSTLRGSLMAS